MNVNGPNGVNRVQGSMLGMGSTEFKRDELGRMGLGILVLFDCGLCNVSVGWWMALWCQCSIVDGVRLWTVDGVMASVRFFFHCVQYCESF
jgi:hypothetical protein